MTELPYEEVELLLRVYSMTPWDSLPEGFEQWKEKKPAIDSLRRRGLLSRRSPPLRLTRLGTRVAAMYERPCRVLDEISYLRALVEGDA